MPRDAPSRRPGGLSSSQSSNARSPKDLLALCETAVTSFNPARQTLDSHANDCISTLKITSKDDQGFVQQVLYGLYRYKALLKAFVDIFFSKRSGQVQRGDIHVYKIFAYLAVFRLEELTLPQFRRLVKASDPQKMLVFLEYLFDEEELRDFVRNDWLKIYDKEFVDSLIDSILQWKPSIATLMQHLSERVYMTKKKEDEGPNLEPKQKKMTEIVAFNLSQSKPKPAPVEEVIPPPIRAKPPPQKLEGPTKEEKAIEAARAANREIQAKKYSDPRRKPFRLRTLERPTNIEKIRQEVESEVIKDLTFKAPAPSSMPKPPTAQVKLTATSILREDALYKKKQSEEVEMLKRYEQELRDHSEFTEWQKEMLQKDDLEKKAAIEDRRQQMFAAQGAAIKAKEDMVEDNLERGRQQKALLKRQEAELVQRKKEEVEQNTSKRKAVVADRAKVAQAHEKLAVEKKLQAEQIRHQEHEGTQHLAHERAKELAERQDIIQQLKALEKVPRKRVNVFDPTDVTQHGLLEEMSLLELRERLLMVKRTRQDEIDAQRNRILRERQEREAMLMDKAENIQQVREHLREQGDERRSEACRVAQEDEENAAIKHQQDVLTLHQKLLAKHKAQTEEKTRLAAVEKQKRFEKQQQAAEAAKGQEKKFLELRSGAKRELVCRQGDRLQAAATRETLRRQEQALRKRNTRNQSKAKKDFIKNYDEKLRELKEQHAERQADDTAHKKILADTQKSFEAEQRARYKALAYEPFKATGSSMRARLTALANGEELREG